MNKSFFIIIFLILSPLTFPLVVFAQTQSLCIGTATITDASQAQQGVMGVISNSAQAAFTVSGPKTYNGSGFFWVQQNIPAGTYTITWETVNGCGTPKQETKNTDSKGSVFFAGNYQNLNTNSGYGTIDLKTNLNKPATFFISGPTSKTFIGTGFTWGSAPAGTYTISYGDVDGYKAPLSKTAILAPGGLLSLYGKYTAVQSANQPLQHFRIESKPVSGADAYVNDILVGKTPAQATAYFGSRSKIRCALEGYEDFNGEYRAPDPGSGITVVDPVTYCLLIAKTKTYQSQQSQGVDSRRQQILPNNDIPMQPSVVQRGFFARFLNTISSFFRNLFGAKNLPGPLKKERGTGLQKSFSGFTL